MPYKQITANSILTEHWFRGLLASRQIIFDHFFPVQDGWNYTHFVTPVSTLERDRYLSQPTLPTSPMRTSPVIVSGELTRSGCQMSRLKALEVPQTCGFPQGPVPRLHQPCWASGDTVPTTRGRSHLCNWTPSTRTTVYTSGSTKVSTPASWCSSGIWVRSFTFLSFVLLPLHFRVREETSVLHWNVRIPVRRGSEKVPGEIFT